MNWQVIGQKLLATLEQNPQAGLNIVQGILDLLKEDPTLLQDLFNAFKK